MTGYRLVEPISDEASEDLSWSMKVNNPKIVTKADVQKRFIEAFPMISGPLVEYVLKSTKEG